MAHVCRSDMLLQRPVGTRWILQTKQCFSANPSFDKSFSLSVTLHRWAPISCLIILVNRCGMWIGWSFPENTPSLCVCVFVHACVCVCLWGCYVRGGFKAVYRFNNSCNCAASSLFPDPSVLPHWCYTAVAFSEGF